ncbi:hypothetical protein JCM11641_000121 [Rhodosporidiobolus odoratus]
MLRLLPTAQAARHLHTLVARAGPTSRAPIASAPTFIPSSSSRLFTSSVANNLPTRLSSSAGSGQGGKKEKEAAKKEKERQLKQKEKERAAREKERLEDLKEREKAKNLKEKERAQKEKDKAKKDKERESALKKKERERAKDDRAKDTARAAKASTRSKLTPPKAPQNSWAIFFGDFLAARKVEHPDEKKTVSVLTKEASPLYYALSEEEKAALRARSEEQRAAYPAILEAWKATLTPEMIREENAVRLRRRKMGLGQKLPLRAPGEPKRPKTGFLRFSQEIRESGPDNDVLKGESNVLKQSTLIAAAWRELSEEQKKVYNDAYALDKQRYLEEKAAFDAEQVDKTKQSGSSTA